MTLCAHNRNTTLGDVRNGNMILSRPGEMVRDAWTAMPSIYEGVRLDAFAVMPNHLHGIIVLPRGEMGFGIRPDVNDDHAGNAEGNEPRLGDVIRRFKSYTANRFRKECAALPDTRLWQRNYYEHIIRDGIALTRIREYIENNVLRWHLDRENNHRTGEDPFDEWLQSYIDGRGRAPSLPES